MAGIDWRAGLVVAALTGVMACGAARAAAEEKSAGAESGEAAIGLALSYKLDLMRAHGGLDAAPWTLPP
jgi:hypothetical protein